MRIRACDTGVCLTSDPCLCVLAVVLRGSLLGCVPSWLTTRTEENSTERYARGSLNCSRLHLPINSNWEVEPYLGAEAWEWAGS